MTHAKMDRFGSAALTVARVLFCFHKIAVGGLQVSTKQLILSIAPPVNIWQRIADHIPVAERRRLFELG